MKTKPTTRPLIIRAAAHSRLKNYSLYVRKPMSRFVEEWIEKNIPPLSEYEADWMIQEASDSEANFEEYKEIVTSALMQKFNFKDAGWRSTRGNPELRMAVNPMTLDEIRNALSLKPQIPDRLIGEILKPLLDQTSARRKSRAGTVSRCWGMPTFKRATEDVSGQATEPQGNRGSAGTEDLPDNPDYDRIMREHGF